MVLVFLCFVLVFATRRPWNKAENKFNNALFSFLLDMKWTQKKTHEGKRWKGPMQYENPSGELMMLPSCIAMIEDEVMKEYVVMYARDQVRIIIQ